jgi:hypothetical protein
MSRYSVTLPLVIPGGHLLALGSDVGSAGGIIWGGLVSVLSFTPRTSLILCGLVDQTLKDPFAFGISSWLCKLSDSATERYRQLEGDPVRGLTEEEVRDMLAVSRM